MKTARIVVVAMIGVAAAVLGYGYWHSENHGAAYISLEYENSGPTKLAKALVKFKDLDGNILAEGVVDDELGIVRLLDPETGGCHEIEKRAPFSAAANKSWRDCFAKQSAWIPTWIDRVRRVQIEHELCFSTDIPVEMSASNDEWLLWWVPHPHIGGKPYTYYSSIIVVREADCIE